jgi:hypothetical protein
MFTGNRDIIADRATTPVDILHGYYPASSHMPTG